MNKNKLPAPTKTFLALTLAAATAVALQADPMGTAFTYQGKLQDGGAPANGFYDFDFKLFDGANTVNQQGATLHQTLVTVSNGLFTVKLDFGNQFPGDARWLETWANTNTQPVVQLNPRQELTPQPYAIFAGTAATVTNQAITTVQLAPGAVTAPQIGTLSAPVPGQVLTYSPAGLAWTTPASSLAWLLNGNGGTGPTNFLGTTDNQALEIKVNNARALRVEPNATSPNLIGGYVGNAQALQVGVTISGGGQSGSPNIVSGSFSTISGGQSNTIQLGAHNSVIGGGLQNVVQSFATAATVSGGSANQASAASSTVGGGQNNRANAASSTVGGGQNNQSGGTAGVIGGGIFNAIFNPYSTIGGGSNNVSAAAFSTVGGGVNNAVSGTNSTVGGGQLNVVSAGLGTVGGGFRNRISGLASTISGGQQNLATNVASTIGGGEQNTNLTYYGTIGGGALNFASAPYSTTIAGGFQNTVRGQDATIGGGSYNTAQGDVSIIAGGQSNYVGTNVQDLGEFGIITNYGGYSSILGGDYNRISSIYSGVGGGSDNLLYGDYGHIGGGYANQIGDPGFYSSSYTDSTIGGGSGNNASASGAVIAGGVNNQVNGNQAAILGGMNNIAWGAYSAVLGGLSNQTGTNNITGNFALAAGRRAKARHIGSFVWGDSTDDDIVSTNANSITFRATGGVRIYSFVDPTHILADVGVRLAPGSGSWASMSDRNAKNGFQAVDKHQILEKVVAMPITTWRYNGEDSSIRHIGPTAQDFMAAFAVGDSDTSITSVDADGVALAAIQALNDRMKDKDTELRALRQMVEEMKQRLDTMNQSK